jgi:uncharacterized repeat protein (TIGR03803 family)
LDTRIRRQPDLINFLDTASEEVTVSKAQIYRLSALAVLVLATAVGYAQTFSVLYNFGSQSGDPSRPQNQGIVAQGRDGNMYSTATYGGANNWGAVFQIAPAGTVTTLYSFCSQAKCADGKYAYGGLTLGTDGNFYGTTYNGGAHDYGTVFKVTPAGGLTVLYSFRNGTDGAFPWSPPIEGTDGNFFGVASQYEGKNGSVYKITPSGKFTLLYYFDGAHGRWPFAPLVQGIDGSFYGTTDRGGSDDLGVVFKITRTGKITVLHSFTGSDGQLCGWRSPSGQRWEVLRDNILRGKV